MPNLGLTPGIFCGDPLQGGPGLGLRDSRGKGVGQRAVKAESSWGWGEVGDVGRRILGEGLGGGSREFFYAGRGMGGGYTRRHGVGEEKKEA